jgi:SpoVK/Ycf46/Vps4 family AAA+-type ATPase
MDDPGRSAGTLSLYAQLIGVPSQVVGDIVHSGQLARWRLFDTAGDTLSAGDAALRLDPPLRAWLLGAAGELAQCDPVLRRVLRPGPWPGAALIEDADRARGLVIDPHASHWSVLAGDGGPASWLALVEAGAAASGRAPIRVRLAAAVTLDASLCGEAGLRLARLARLTGSPLLLDAEDAEPGRTADEALEALLQALGNAGVAGTIVTADPARAVRLLGTQRYRIESEEPSAPTRLAALVRAAEQTGAQFTAEAAESLANLYPLQIGGMEQAMRLAQARPTGTGPDARRARFITACKEVSAEGASGLAQRIEPMFDLNDVVLPPDRKGQLSEIVDNVRFAPKVLEGWNFRDQLPYGLGVTALFHGPSGTGKTMASMAVARALGIQLLRIDLSRVVSKYIGETEKNIDRVFVEAQLSGAGLLIDEAEGLTARRSEVKDAHDRYANLEVAYLLQRMEAFEGLCILTSNLRQNIDSAFLRRLRFIIEFPRPDAGAREEIWRRCLPEQSHELDDAAFRMLARRIELTGGSIRQITLRAAFLAAAGGTQIGWAHVTHAARAEFAKLGLPPVELELVERAAA